MGLLDDAIREHLELKRLHGADPGAVAREEHEVFRGAATEDLEDSEASSEELGAVGGFDDGDGHHMEAGSAPTSDGGGAAFPTVGQETLELDMSTVLYDDDVDVGVGPGDVESVGRNSREVRELSPPIPGQERFGFE
jgi:hypothetical protein